MTSQEVVDFVKDRLDKMKPAKICEEVSTHASNIRANAHLLRYRSLHLNCYEVNFNNFSLLKLFKHCLAPDTSGDGTGCDNMTAIIVTFDDIRHTQKRKMEPVDEILPKKGKEEEDAQADQ